MLFEKFAQHAEKMAHLLSPRINKRHSLNDYDGFCRATPKSVEFKLFFIFNEITDLQILQSYYYLKFILLN